MLDRNLVARERIPQPSILSPNPVPVNPKPCTYIGEPESVFEKELRTSNPHGPLKSTDFGFARQNRYLVARERIVRVHSKPARFRVEGSVFRDHGSGFMAFDSRHMVYGLWFMVYGLWFMVYGL